MSIVVTCDTCGKKLKAPDKYEGKKGKCPTCGAAILVTRQAAAPEAAAADATGPAPAPQAEAQPATAPNAGQAAAGALKLLMMEKFGDFHIVRFATSRVLDGSNVEQLGQEFSHIINDLYAVKLIVNFEKVKYMSSAVLGKLITLNKMVAAEKGKLKFCCIHPSVMEIFKIMKLDKLFKIFESEEKAVESFGKWFG